MIISKISDPQQVKVRQEIEEADHYDYGITSLRSLKAFEWLSFDHYSSDDSPVSVVRIPGSNFPKSPTPSFKASKETNNCGSNKTKRATSAPRRLCCAVLSSPDRNKVISRSKTQTRRELLSPLRSHTSCLDRHTRCKIPAISGDADAHNKHLTESKKHVLVRGSPRPADVKQQKKKGM